MKKMQPLLYIRNRTNSLFHRLIAGFLCIVLLLASLTLYSLYVTKKSVEQEVVKYNTSLLANTRDSYEKHLDLIRKQMLLFMSSETIWQLQHEASSAVYPVIVREIQRWTSVPYMHIENIVFYSKKNELIIERSTSASAESMFNVFTASREYPLSFWRQQFAEPYSFRVLPSATFDNLIFKDSPEPLGEMIPVVIKGVYTPDFYMIVFLDAVRMYEAFHQSVHKDFMIYDDGGRPIFGREGEEPMLSLEEIREAGASGKFIRNGTYYFAFASDATGFTYVSRVPADTIAAQTRINATLLVTTLSAFALSILFSFVFAARINNPLRKVIESIRGMNADRAPYRSNIKEFDMISGQIHGNWMLFEHISFFNRLKAIRNQGPEAASLDFTDKPFVFVLFHMQPGENESNPPEVMQNWLYYVRIFIDSRLKPEYPDSLTFQIEREQILSLIFTDRSEDVVGTLESMKTVFDQDREHGIMTMVVTSTYSASSQLTAAYEEAQELAGERLLTDATQIVDRRGAPPVASGFSSDREKELEANLRGGNAAQLTALLELYFAKWRRTPPTAASLARFAESTASKIRNSVVPFPLDPEEIDAVLGREGERIARCRTVRELEELLIEWVTRTAEAVRVKKDEKRPVTALIAEYIEEHLAEEMYLDVLAEKFKMSSGYLSTYFKAKTGMNLVDYINETRIKKAASLLDEEALKIREAAERVGYRNITSFNRMFKKYTGLTPTEYRKRNESA